MRRIGLMRACGAGLVGMISALALSAVAPSVSAQQTETIAPAARAPSGEAATPVAAPSAPAASVTAPAAAAASKAGAKCSGRMASNGGRPWGVVQGWSNGFCSVCSGAFMSACPLTFRP